MNVNYLKIQYRVNPKNNKNCLNIWPFGKFYLLLCINSPPLSMKRCHFITIFSYILFFPTALSAGSIDSLYHEIERQERVKLSSANQLMLLLDAEGTTDSLFHFDQHTEKEAMLSTIHLYMAAHFYEQATNMVHTLQAARRAEAAARAIGDTATIEEALAYQAVAASRMGRLDVALDATREELRLDSLSQNLPNLSRAYNTLAGLSLQAGRMEDAKLYIHKAINLERALEDSTHLSVRYGVAAEIYAKDKNYEQALDFAQRAYELDRTAGNEVRTARRLAQMADIYDAKGDLTNAEKFYLRSIEVLRAEKEQKSLAINLKQLGQNYLRQHRTKEAIQVLEECEQICRATDNRYTLQQTCRLLAEAYHGQAPQKAFAYLHEALLLNDTLHSQRAEQLAEEVRKSQNDTLEELSDTPSSPSRSIWHTILLLSLAAACGICIGRFWSRLRTKSESEKNERPVADDSQLLISEPEEIAVATTSEKNNAHAREDREFLAKVAELYEQNLEHHRMSIDDLASELCMSRSQFTRRLSAAAGMPASNFLNRIRLEKACRLLKDTEKPVSTIAYECGFDDTSYFSNLFKKQYMMTPMQYRITPK